MHFRRSNPIQDAAEIYAAQLRRELDTCPSTGSPAQLPALVDWSWVFAAETEVLRRLPDSEIRRRAWAVYDRYADVAGPEKAARRAAANSLDPDKCETDILRADLIQIQGETARILTIGYEIERERGLLTQLIMCIAIGALAALAVIITLPTIVVESTRWILISLLVLVTAAIVLGYRARHDKTPPSIAPPPAVATDRPQMNSRMAIVFVLLFSLWSKVIAAETIPLNTTTNGMSAARADGSEAHESNSPGLPLGPLVAIAGVMGATFSILQRAHRSTLGTDPVLALFSLRAARRQAYLSIISGALSALVIFCVFAGGMVQGTLFPTFVNKFNYGPTVRFPMKLYDYFNSTGPQTHQDHAKLLVWCFIGGFAERFVPDMLDRFTSAAKK